jgi:hypothetical protein
MPEGIGYSVEVDLEPALGKKKKPDTGPMSLKQATKKAALSALEKKKKKGEAVPAKTPE